MKYSIEITKRCEKDIKNYKKKHYDFSLFCEVVELLANDDKKILKTKFKDHALFENWKGYRELHLEKNILIIYKIDEEKLALTLTRIGSHDDLGLNWL